MLRSPIEKEIHLTLFCDERKIDSDVQINGENWFYICLLLIPTDQIFKLKTKLDICRKKNNYHHEMSFKDIGARSVEKVNLCKSWLDCLEYDEERQIYYKILGINRDNLNKKCFGEKMKFDVVYNRFFRTTVDGAVSHYFSDYHKIYIDQVFHDNEGGLESNYYFQWHLAYKLSSKEVTFCNKEITFINSDHTKEQLHTDKSHLIQLADVLIGTVSHALDVTSKYKTRHEVSLHYSERIKNILTNPNNIRSRGYKKYDISFFPSKILNDEELETPILRANSSFYRNRDIMVLQQKQPKLLIL